MKELYFLRHGIAVLRGTPGYPDDDRPLTEEGIAKMARAARGIARLVDGFDLIASSPLKRAHETALIVARQMKCENLVRTANALLPGCTVKSLMNFLVHAKSKDRVLVVGHEPDLGCMASTIIGAPSSVIRFKKGALCCLDMDQPAPGTSGALLWHAAPKLLRMIGK